MIGLIKSDFYKILRTKSFYICGGLAAIFAALSVVMMDVSSRMQYAMYGLEDLYASPYTGAYSLVLGLANATLFATIVVSMFIPSEFKFGTVKNIASRGISRSGIYLSKLTITVFVSIVYSLLCGAVAFVAGCYTAGVGELNRNEMLNVFAVVMLFLLAEVALQSIFQMVGFMVRGTGWSMITNIGIQVFVPTMIFGYIDFAINSWIVPLISSNEWLSSWIQVSDFSISNYFPLEYLGKFTEIDISHISFYKHDIIMGIIVSVVYLVLSTLAGMLNFRRRDVV